MCSEGYMALPKEALSLVNLSNVLLDDQLVTLKISIIGTPFA